METPLQRLLSRAVRAKKQVTKKNNRKDAIKHFDEKWSYNESLKIRRGIIRKINEEAIRNYKEDYEVGGRLLPRRDIGSNKLSFGTVDENLFYGATKPEKWRRKPWMAVGDQVLVMDGRDKGAIAKVSDIQEDQETCTLTDHNKVNSNMPEWMAQEDSEVYAHTVRQNMSISWDKLKLVTRLSDKNGKRKVIVEEVRVEDGIATRGKPAEPRRFIAGSDIELKWPKKPEEEEHEEHDVDTLRITVDDVTFQHTLHNPPMPPAVIDELRNKYSKYRTRHDPEYIAKVNSKANRELARQKMIAKKGLTPLMRQVAEHKEQRSKVASELTQEQLASIGESVARAQGKAAESSAGTGRPVKPTSTSALADVVASAEASNVSQPEQSV